MIGKDVLSKLLFFLLTLVLCVFLSVECVAVYTNFQTEEINESEKKNVLESLAFQEIDVLMSTGTICCVAMSTDGDIALGYRSNTISVFDKNGAYQYGYRFKTAGDFYLEWVDNALNVYLVRSGLIVSVESQDIQKVANSLENDQYFRKNLKSIRVSNGTIECFLSNPPTFTSVFASGYSIATLIDQEGHQIELYNSSISTQNTTSIVLMVVIVLLIVITSIILKSFFRRQR